MSKPPAIVARDSPTREVSRAPLSVHDQQPTHECGRRNRTSSSPPRPSLLVPSSPLLLCSHSSSSFPLGVCRPNTPGLLPRYHSVPNSAWPCVAKRQLRPSLTSNLDIGGRAHEVATIGTGLDSFHVPSPIYLPSSHTHIPALNQIFNSRKQRTKIRTAALERISRPYQHPTDT